jgi:hypothetical protein
MPNYVTSWLISAVVVFEKLASAFAPLGVGDVKIMKISLVSTRGDL